MSIRNEVALSEAQYEVVPAPDWTIENIVDWNLSSTEEQSIAGLIIDNQFNISTHESYHRNIKKLTSPYAVQALSQAIIDFDPSAERLLIHEVAVHRLITTGKGKYEECDWEKRSFAKTENLKIRQRETNLESYAIDGRANILVLLENVQLGDAIEISYTLQPIAPIEGFKFARILPLSYPYRVGWLHSSIVFEEGQSISWDTHNLPQEIETQGELRCGLQAMSWRIWHPEVLSLEYNTPTSHIYAPTLEISCWENWGEIAQFILETWRDAKEASSDEIPIKLSELTSADDTIEQKILSCLTFIQEEVRYLAVDMGQCGGIIPAHTETTLRRLYGDCKDKTLLFIKFLDELGVESFPVLVGTDWKDRVENFNPSSVLFNHVIAAVELEGERYYLDPTIKSQGGSLKKRSKLPYKLGLPIRENTTEFIKIPSPAVDDFLIELTENFYLKKNNDGSYLKFNIRCSGIAADFIRLRISQVGLNGFLKEEAKHLSSVLPNTVAGSEPAPSLNDDNEQNEIVIEGYFVIKEWGRSHDGGKIFEYPARVLNYGIDQVDATEVRKLPWSLPYPNVLVHHISVDGEHFTPTMDETKHVKGPGFEYSYKTYNSAENSPAITYRWRNTAEVVQAKNWGDYLKKREKAFSSTVFNAFLNTSRRISKPNEQKSSSRKISSGVIIAVLVVLWIILLMSRIISNNVSYSPPSHQIEQPSIVEEVIKSKDKSILEQLNEYNSPDAEPYVEQPGTFRSTVAPK